MFDTKTPSGSHETENVEPDIDVVQALLVQPDLGAPHDSKLLGTIDRLERMSEVALPPGLHFDEHDQSKPPDNQVDFSIAKRDISRDDRETTQPIEPSGSSFSGSSQSRAILSAVTHHGI